MGLQRDMWIGTPREMHIERNTATGEESTIRKIFPCPYLEGYFQASGHAASGGINNPWEEYPHIPGRARDTVLIGIWNVSSQPLFTPVVSL